MGGNPDIHLLEPSLQHFFVVTEEGVGLIRPVGIDCNANEAVAIKRSSVKPASGSLDRVHCSSVKLFDKVAVSDQELFGLDGSAIVIV